MRVESFSVVAEAAASASPTSFLNAFYGVDDEGDVEDVFVAPNTMAFAIRACAYADPRELRLAQVQNVNQPELLFGCLDSALVSSDRDDARVTKLAELSSMVSPEFKPNQRVMNALLEFACRVVRPQSESNLKRVILSMSERCEFVPDKLTRRLLADHVLRHTSDDAKATTLTKKTSETFSEADECKVWLTTNLNRLKSEGVRTESDRMDVLLRTNASYDAFEVDTKTKSKEKEKRMSPKLVGLFMQAYRYLEHPKGVSRIVDERVLKHPKNESSDEVRAKFVPLGLKCVGTVGVCGVEDVERLERPVALARSGGDDEENERITKLGLRALRTHYVRTLGRTIEVEDRDENEDEEPPLPPLMVVVDDVEPQMLSESYIQRVLNVAKEWSDEANPSAQNASGSTLSLYLRLLLQVMDRVSPSMRGDLLTRATTAFDAANAPDVENYDLLVATLFKCGEPRKAINVLGALQSNGLVPTAHTVHALVLGMLESASAAPGGLVAYDVSEATGHLVAVCEQFSVQPFRKDLGALEKAAKLTGNDVELERVRKLFEFDFAEEKEEDILDSF